MPWTGMGPASEPQAPDTPQNTAGVDLAAIRARYEQNRRPRSNAWRSLDDLPVVLDLCERQQREIDALRDLVYELHDLDPCWFDHNGYCQAHGWPTDEKPCPHARAKRLLAELSGGDTTPADSGTGEEGGDRG